MAVVTNATLRAIRTQLNTDFKKGFEGASTNHEVITMVVPSSSASNTYGWLGAMPSVREWIGDRVINDVAEHGYAISNKDFELAIGVKRTDIEDDNLGIYSPLMEDIGQSMKKQPGKMVYILLAAGFTTACYDGQYFFDTDHPVNAKHDGSGAVTSVSNIQPGTGTNAPWFLVDGSRPLKPIIYQDRKKPVFTAMTSLTDESVFTSNVFRFGSDMRGNVGFGLWQQAYASKETLIADNFNACRTAMMSITKDGGEPLGIKPTQLVVGASNLVAAEKLIETKTLANGEDNPLYKKAEIVYSDYLA